MTYLRLVARLLLTRGLTHALAVIVIAVGSSLVVTALATRDAATMATSDQATRYPLVVGGRVGAVPLVLGAMTGLQDLGAAVDERWLTSLRSDPRVAEVVPLLGGHAIGGFAVVATSPGYLLPRARFPLAQGRTLGDGQDELVLGHDAAVGLGAELGSTLALEHYHDDAPSEPTTLRVVGVLGPTGTHADQSVFCTVEALGRSHRAQHEHAEGTAHGRLSALLVRPVNDAALLALQQELGDDPALGVALTGQTLRRVADQLSVGGRLLGLVIGGVIVLTLLSLLLSVYGTAVAQAREVAVLRVMGASRGQLVGIGTLSTAAVVLAGLGVGLAVAAALARRAEQLLRHDLGLDARVDVLGQAPLGALIVAALLLLAMGIQPSIAAYRLEAADALGRPAGSGHATRSYLRWSLRILLPLGVFLWAQNALVLHGSEPTSRPLEPRSAELFRALAQSKRGAAGELLQQADGTLVTLEGYMYSLGDPFVVQDFYLVAMDPRLPRCPFCYRAPTSRERIHVHTGGRSVEVSNTLVRVTGTLRLTGNDDDPAAVTLTKLEVVLP